MALNPNTKNCNILTSIDIFGREFKFTINGGALKTNLGGIFTILVASMTIALGWYFGKDLFEKNDPFFYINKDYLDVPPMFSPWKNGIKNTDLFVAFRFLNEKKVLFDDITIVEPYFAYHYKKVDPVTKKFTTGFQFQLPIRCTNEFIDQETLDFNNLDQYYCVKYDRNLEIGGDQHYGNYNHGRLHYYLRLCDKGTEQRYNITCASEEERQEKLPIESKKYVEVIYQKNLIYPSNHTSPYKKSYVLFQEAVDTVFFNLQAKHLSLEYSKSLIETDNALIFSEYSNQYFLEFSEKATSNQPTNNFPDSDSYIPDESFFFKAVVYIGRSTSHYKRSYIKIPDIIANVGGFISIVMWIIQFFYSFYIDNEYMVYFMQRLFNLKIESNEDFSKDTLDINKNINLNAKVNPHDNNNEAKNVSSLELVYDQKNTTKRSASQRCSLSRALENQVADEGGTIIDIERNKSKNQQKTPETINKKERFTNYKPKYEDMMILNKDIANLLEYKKKKGDIVEISFCERSYFSICFCSYTKFKDKKDPRKLRYELMLSAEKLIERKSDIFDLWSELDQLQLLKKIVLNEEQCFMLKNRGLKLITNKISLNTNDEIRDLEDKKSKEKLAKLIEYLNSGNKEEKLNKVDNLLVSYLDSHFFEELKA